MIKRYDFTDTGIIESEDGGYVKSSDYEHLDRILHLALEYWRDRQQRYKNRAPVWVKEARAAIGKVDAGNKEVRE